MPSNDNFNSKNTLSPQLTHRSDARSIQDHDSVGGRGDFTAGNVNLNVQFPLVKSSKTSVFSDTYIDKPTFSGNQVEWNKADYDFNNNFLYDYMVKQRQYLKHDDDKYARNRELLANMKTMRQKDYDDTIRKKSEIERLKREVKGYEWQIKHQSALGETSTFRFSAEDKLNRDLIKQRKRLIREKELQLKNQIEEGIVPEVIDAHDSAKRLLENEEDRRLRLQQKSQWYDTELVNIKEAVETHANASVKGVHLPSINKGKVHSVQDKIGHPNKMTYESFKDPFPGINKETNNLINLALAQENRDNYGQCDKKIRKASDINKGYVPQPPLVKKDREQQRLHRKMRNVIR